MMAYVALSLLALSTLLLTRLDKKSARLCTVEVDGRRIRGARVVRVSRLASGLVGLLNHTELAARSGLYLSGSREVHTEGMLFPLDVVFLDRRGRVLRVDEMVTPGQKKIRGPRGTRAVLELAAGSAADIFGIHPGFIVTLNPQAGI
jgi:uncharacterized membrane protein (UPF0127 family)